MTWLPMPLYRSVMRPRPPIHPARNRPENSGAEVIVDDFGLFTPPTGYNRRRKLMSMRRGSFLGRVLLALLLYATMEVGFASGQVTDTLIHVPADYDTFLPPPV